MATTSAPFFMCASSSGAGRRTFKTTSAVESVSPAVVAIVAPAAS